MKPDRRPAVPHRRDESGERNSGQEGRVPQEVAAASESTRGANRQANTDSSMPQQSPSERMLPRVNDEVAGGRRGLPAWAISLSIHVLIFVALGIVLRPVVHGVQDGGGKEGQIVLVSNNNSKTEFLSEEDITETESESSSSNANEASESPFPQTTESALDTTGLFPTTDGLIGPSGSSSGGLPDAGDLLSGLGNGASAQGSQSSTQVFGIKGQGSKFVYVFDRSSSMEGFGGRPLAAAKAELIASLKQIGSNHQFQIIFYNDDPAVFDPYGSGQPTMMFGSEENMTSATRFVSSIRGVGGTRHLEPMTLALNFSPDVIFFLTDAQDPAITEAELNLIQKRNRSAASINTIEFGSGPQSSRESFMARLARQNHGQHVYIDVSKLPNTRR